MMPRNRHRLDRTIFDAGRISIQGFEIEGAPAMAETVDKEALYRKLTRARRLIAGPLDPVTVDRLKAYSADLKASSPI
jgi:hypothetical protein